MANTFAERWIGNIRRELLDRNIIWNQQQLERLVVDYIGHLDQQPPKASEAPPPGQGRHLRVVKSSRCDGLINEYRNAA